MEININQEEFLMETANIALEGKHNMKNAMAATSVANILRIRKQTIRESLSNFQGVEHRLEYVDTVNGRKFYNDTEATNIKCTQIALASFDEPTILILGGLERSQDFFELFLISLKMISVILSISSSISFFDEYLESNL